MIYNNISSYSMLTCSSKEWITTKVRTALGMGTSHASHCYILACIEWYHNTLACNGQQGVKDHHYYCSDHRLLWYISTISSYSMLTCSSNEWITTKVRTALGIGTSHASHCYILACIGWYHNPLACNGQ